MALLPAPDVSLVISAQAIANRFTNFSQATLPMPQLTEHVQILLDFENEDPASSGDMAPGGEMASLNHLITPMGRVYLVAVVLDLWTVFNAILNAHGKEFGINSGGSGTRMTGQLPPDAFEEDQTLGGNWIKDKIDTIPIRAPGFVSDDVPAEASRV
ncbi:hypothetical protein FANTH_1084 [Fusarium anthophilum]|uniref:Uncharacterized protein n=1 Tax=Fusarium anthophilum TaxID=48485 RepID=A0A8H4ZWP5_9HYPO|nr:hypothetical protein FANTH_1084 [Fusarium anthophilum]